MNKKLLHMFERQYDTDFSVISLQIIEEETKHSYFLRLLGQKSISDCHFVVSSCGNRENRRKTMNTCLATTIKSIVIKGSKIQGKLKKVWRLERDVAP